MQEDGLHPTAAGQPRVLENVWPVLQQTLAALPVSAS
jgi:acyl-CoA thioesterase-1